MRILVPLVAALVPLVIAPGLLFHFDITPKAAILLYGASLLAIFWRENWLHVKGLLELPEGRWFSALLGLQLASLAISTLFSADPNLSLYGSEWRRFGLAAATALILFAVCAAAWMRTSHNLTLLLRACVASGSLVSLYAIAQYFGWDPFLPSAGYHAGEGPFTIVRPPGTLGHADYLAAFLVFVFFCALALARTGPLRWVRILNLATAGLAATGVLLSGTRAALVGLAVGGLVLLILDRRGIQRRQIAAAAVGLVLLAAFVISPAGEKLRARVLWSRDDPFGGARVLLWRDSLRMAAVRPVLGFGPESFVVEFPRFQSLELARAYPDFYHESPHNLVLDTLVAQGAAGAVLVLAGWAVAVLAGLRAWKVGCPWAAPLVAGAVGMLANQQFSVLILPTGMAFYLIQAMLIGSAPGEAKEAPAPPPSLWAVPAVVLATLFAVLATRLTVADYKLSAAQRRIAVRDVPGAKSDYEAHRAWSPTGSSADLDYSRAMIALASTSDLMRTRLDASTEALRAGTNAVRFSEQRANAWYSLATVFASLGDQGSVERCLRNAIAWAPNWFKPHWTLAQLLQLSGRHDEAVREAAAALEGDGGKNPEVLATWTQLEQSGPIH